ncbi:histidine kinase, phosphotransfer Hpt [Cyathus striatus]|nr:histidine kinase, phosphotransfer Hpt [Cyathus striatus]
MDIFQQILDLDEDTHEFSRGMTLEYFSQVESTFEEMDEALKQRDLLQLSTLGHFLKGSSAALGVAKVQASCEKIQHYGQLRDEQKNKDLSKEEALGLISKLLSQVKKEYIEAERCLMEWYAANPDPE